jgi:hypothetical protein
MDAGGDERTFCSPVPFPGGTLAGGRDSLAPGGSDGLAARQSVSRRAASVPAQGIAGLPGVNEHRPPLGCSGRGAASWQRHRPSASLGAEHKTGPHQSRPCAGERANLSPALKAATCSLDQITFRPVTSFAE